MDLNLEIEQDLWENIKKNYENQSYKSAVLDAIHFVTETIRNKTGLEGDGASLVGQAFGGEDPKIRLNKLQTDSEKDTQKGIQEILKGLYTGIRNPRSHDDIKDTKKETDAIIIFVDYLLSIIDKSKLSFEEELFLKRIFDEHFVKSKEYSDLLIEEIPKRQRASLAISIIKRRVNGDVYCLAYFMTSLFEKLDQVEISRIYKVVSEELKYTSSFKDIQTILKICPAIYWSKIDRAVKLRIEKLLEEDVKLGQYDIEQDEINENGSLGTWISAEHLVHFENISSWNYLLVNKLKSTNKLEYDYIITYFWSKLCKINRDNLEYSFKLFIQNAFKTNNEKIVKKIESEIEWDEDHPWWEIFKDELKDYPDIKINDIDMPF